MFKRASIIFFFFLVATSARAQELNVGVIIPLTECVFNFFTKTNSMFTGVSGRYSYAHDGKIEREFELKWIHDGNFMSLK